VAAIASVSQKEMAAAAAVMCVQGMTCSTFVACVRKLEAEARARVPSRREKRRGQVEPGQRRQTPAGDSQHTTALR
jgi:hypothetical protein